MVWDVDNQLSLDAIIAALAGASGYTLSTDDTGMTTITETATGYVAFVGGPDNATIPVATFDLIFEDINYDPLNSDAAFINVSGAAAVSGLDKFKGLHERLVIEYTVPKDGYTDIAVRHEEDKNIDVFFDDIKVTHLRKGVSVVQADDYYPFGSSLQSTSYQRTGSLKNHYLYNGKELQEERTMR
jgi:hypothetical protein